MRVADAYVITFIAAIAIRVSGQASQTPPTLTPEGVVTGHVFCADTQRPGRFAEVALLRKPDESAGPATPNRDAPGRQSASRPAPQVVYESTRSLLDGSYVIRHVPQGDYFVVAKMDGYLVPVSTPSGKDDSDDTEVSLDDLLSDSPVVHVAANQTIQADVTIRRGGAISGRVLFDDGTPVVGASVQAQPAKDESLLTEGPNLRQQISRLTFGRYQGTTDDQGRYRIPGLVPGKYRVLTTINFKVENRVESVGPSEFREGAPAPGIVSTLRLYQPGTFRRSEAKVFEVKGDEDDTGEDITVPTDGLHSVEGRVLAASDRHVPDLVVVTVAMDDEVGGMVFVSADGSFRMDYLPKGTYTVATQASDYEPGTTREIRRYERKTATVVIDEHDVVMDDLQVVEAKPKP